MIADAHSDLLLELVAAEHGQAEAEPFRARWLEPLRRGAVDLQVCAIYVDPDRAPDDALREVLRNARSFALALEQNPADVQPVRSASDLDSLGGERIGLMLSIEGVSSFGPELWPLDVLAALGLRMASLTWNERNPFADGCDHDGGLTPLGAELVERMLAHGILVDLAHASAQTFDDVLAITPPGTVLVSHAACRALYDHPRNLSDVQLRALAAHGGVLGLMPHPFVLGPREATMATFLDHVEHAIAVAGPEHVALGGDFLRQIARALGETEEIDGMAPDAQLEGLEGPQDYPALVAALRARGLADDELAPLLRDNLLRLLASGLPEG